jgi:hypothetical protein
MFRLQDTASTPPAQTAAGPTIVPAGQSVDAGFWRLAVVEAQVGDAAAATLAAANAENPDAPEGLVYALARVSAENTSDQPQVINLSDFAGSGTDGVLRRAPALIVPEPALQARVDPASAAEGWIPLTVNDAGNAILWFSSPFLGGDWGDAVLALTDGAAIPAFDPPGDDPRRGESPEAPAGFNETVRTGNWDISVVEHISGQAVYNIAEFALQALAGGNASDPEVETWHAVRVRATNVSDRPAFFSYTALHLADANGEAWDHILALTPPRPDVAREVLPGATREGWAAFQKASWASLDLLRVQPSIIADAPRFITFGTAPADTTDATATEAAPLPELNEGDLATLTEDLVNLRSEPSASAEIVAELAQGSELTITGASVEADGYTWYPVMVNGTDETGYVVADYLAPAQGG